MIKNVIILVLIIVTINVLFLDSEPEATVTTPEVTKSDGYLRPVREGNCWRQYVGRGDRDSILVCH